MRLIPSRDVRACSGHMSNPWILLELGHINEVTASIGSQFHSQQFRAQFGAADLASAAWRVLNLLVDMIYILRTV